MDIQSLIEINSQIAERSTKMRSKRSWLPRLFRNWLRNSDGEAECQEQILKNQNQLFCLFNGELSKVTQALMDHPFGEKKLFADMYIVHSLVKVGGMSIAATLSANFKEATVIHVHCITDEGCKRWAMCDFQMQSMRDSVDGHVNAGRKTAMLLEAGKLLFPTSQKRVVICGVREPIAWALSLYFYSFAALFDRRCNEITAEMASKFVVSVLADKEQHFGIPFMNPHTWLTEEFAPAHKINVFDHDFDIEKGYQIYDGDKVRILLIRQESLSVLPEALSELLGYPASLIKTVKENAGESRDYAECYRSIQEKVRFDSSFLQSIYSSPYCQKFYSEAERQSFLLKWNA